MKKTFNTKQIPCFKRWTRKPYGIFASMHREVKIGVLAVSMSILLPATKAKAQSDADTATQIKVLQIEAIDVAGNKASPTRSAMSQTPIFNRKAEAAAPLQTLEAAMRQSPAIDVRERGGKGIQTDISIRGGSFDQTMIMLNGINFTDARTGHQTHSLPIDIDLVGGIELIDGVSGVGAYAGAINIRTQPLAPKYLRTEIAGGQHGYLYSNISGAMRTGGFSAFGAASYRRSDGYTHNTDFGNFNAYVRANYENTKVGFFDFQAGYQSRSFGANGFYSLKYAEQYEHTSTALGSLRWIKSVTAALTLNSTISYRKNFDRFELIKNHPETVPYNYHNTDNAGAELWADYVSRFGKTSLGGDYTFNHIYSTVLGEVMSKPKKVSGADGIFYTKQKSRNTGNAWLRHVKRWTHFEASASGGLSFTDYGTTAIWSASGTYIYNENLRFDVGAAQSMRLPTFTDLYYTATGYVGNADLKPEKAVTFRMGATYSKSKLNALATVYYRRGRNIIDWVRASATDDWHSEQITRLNTCGAELAAMYNFGGFVKNISVKYGYISTNKKSSGQESKYALDYMKHKAVVSAEMEIVQNLLLVLSGSLYDRNGTYTNADGNKKDFKPYVLLDGRLTWQHKILKIYVDATNITATNYFDFGGLKMPKTWFVGGIAVQL